MTIWLHSKIKLPPGMPSKPLNCRRHPFRPGIQWRTKSLNAISRIYFIPIITHKSHINLHPKQHQYLRIKFHLSRPDPRSGSSLAI